eukprot:CAMPEP_0172589134 /NCGR_PEP_ID=MMETSP1068-20121228/7939_1 /TAXON_ID=35684 /ORGANISM="Pseudopedinella elastica, Strain CCMP716" /LENGTH=40 /DNA_ID= /DNA_START= /DNA_END= /DNA_ORIENTATION=
MEAGQAATEGRYLGAWAGLILELPGTPPCLRASTDGYVGP